MAKIIQQEYTMPLKVASYDVDIHDRIRLSAVLRYQQEAAERHLGPAGLGWRELGAQGIAFVTSRWHTVIHRLPLLEETVSLTTWHRERKGPRFFRCYEWRDESSALLLEGVMQFALVSVTDHRLLRGDEFMRLAPLPDIQRGVTCADPGRFPTAELSPAGEYRVRWSDLDRNGHMNNTHYADFLCDFVPGGMTDLEPRDIQLHFAGECRLGDDLTMTASRMNDTACVVGETQRGRAFSAQVIFQDGV